MAYDSGVAWAETVSTIDHIREAMQRHGITAPDIAPRLGVTPEAVYTQFTRTPRASTVDRYARALTEVLNSRGDQRRFTTESLQRGPDPEPIPAEEQHERLKELLAGLHIVPVREVEPGEEIVVPIIRGAGACGVAVSEGAEVVGHQTIPREKAGPGATAGNTVYIRAEGESLTGDGIEDGDLLLCRTDVEVHPPRPHGYVIVEGVVWRVSGDGVGLAARARDGGYRVSSLRGVRPQAVVVRLERSMVGNGH